MKPSRVLALSQLFSYLLLLGLITSCSGSSSIFDSEWDSRNRPGSLGFSHNGYAAALQNQYQANALAVLQLNCVSCHAATAGPGGIYGFGDPTHMVLAGLIVPGQPSQSPLYTSVANGTMPPTGALSSSDQQILSSWIATPASTGVQEQAGADSP